MKSFPKKQNKDGFSIIEVIVAVGIITVGIIPIISLFTQNLNNEIKNENMLIASYLANESIEIVRQERDDNWTAGDDWMTNITADGSKVIVGLNNTNDIRRGWEVVVPGSANYKKVYLTDEGFYAQLDNSPPGNWKKTSFERYLEITENSADGTAVAGCLGISRCVEIISYVSFNGTQTVEITAYLYDGWK